MCSDIAIQINDLFLAQQAGQMKTVERTGPELRGQAGGNLRWRFRHRMQTQALAEIFRNRGKPRFADGRQTGVVQNMGRDRACGAPEKGNQYSHGCNA